MRDHHHHRKKFPRAKPDLSNRDPCGPISKVSHPIFIIALRLSNLRTTHDMEVGRTHKHTGWINIPITFVDRIVGESKLGGVNRV